MRTFSFKKNLNREKGTRLGGKDNFFTNRRLVNEYFFWRKKKFFSAQKKNSNSHYERMKENKGKNNK